MNVAAEMALAAIFLSGAAERLVGYFDPLWELVPIPNFKRYVSFAIGGFLGWLFQLDLVSELIPTAPLVPWAGALLTALIIGGGSNLVHELWPSGK